MQNESVKCPARAVFAKSRARHVHIMSLNLLTTHKSPLDKPGLLCSLVSDYRWITTHAFARSADFEFQLMLYLGPSNFGSEIVLKNGYR